MFLFEVSSVRGSQHLGRVSRGFHLGGFESVAIRLTLRAPASSP